MPDPKFEMGRLVMTTNLQNTLMASDPEGWQEELNLFVVQHLMGEWGEMSTEDVEINERGLVNGDGLHSAYTTRLGIKIWIITEWDRSITTCLLPEDY